jgi:hypothetical protein
MFRNSLLVIFKRGARTSIRPALYLTHLAIVSRTFEPKSKSYVSFSNSCDVSSHVKHEGLSTRETLFVVSDGCD